MIDFYMQFQYKDTLFVYCILVKKNHICLQDQITADGNLSMKQRAALAGGSALQGVGGVAGKDVAVFAQKAGTIWFLCTFYKWRCTMKY